MEAKRAVGGGLRLGWRRGWIREDTHRKTEIERHFADGRGGRGLAWSRIIRQQVSLVIYKIIHSSLGWTESESELGKYCRLWYNENEECRLFGGCKTEIYDAFTNTFFDFLSRFLASKFSKSTNMTPKNYVLKKSKKITKNAEFHADFESVEKVF